MAMSVLSNIHWLFKVAVAKKLITLEQCPAPDLFMSTLQVWSMLEDMGISQEKVLDTILSCFALEVADLSKVSPNASLLLDNKTSRKYDVIPLYSTDNELVIATFDPFDNETEQFLKFVSGRMIVPRITTPKKIAEYLDGGMSYSISSIIAQLNGEDSESHSSQDILNDDENLPLVIRLVNTIIIRAIAERVSDIHIMYNSGGCQVRFRADGVLHTEAKIPRQIADNVMTRLKVMAGVNISATLLPQDGRAKLYAGGRLVDLRFNFVPTLEGSKATIRIQDSRQRKQLSQIGYSDTELLQFKRLINSKMGLILVTGPTGSGKTNTLYAALDHIRDDSKNIISIEDPVEFMDKEITQIQVNDKIGFSFAKGLRAAMRQDPDIIMVGEIRDRETAETALQASETGHLVLSTLHTRSAVGAILRLQELGVNKGLLANSIAGIVAQRLLRKLCPHCAKRLPYKSIHSLSAIEKKLLPKDPVICEPVGCSYCHQSGYYGRIAIAEILGFTPEIQ